MIKSAVSIQILFSLFSMYLYAQTSPGTTEQTNTHSTAVNHHLNELAVFAGATSQVEKKGTHFSLGLDYLRVLNESRRWAAGGFTEVIFTKHPEWLFGLLFYYRSIEAFWIRSGPGIEILKHEETDPECGCVHTTSHTEFLLRAGVGYSFHTKNMTIAPTIDIDFVRSTTAIVWGINIGTSF